MSKVDLVVVVVSSAPEVALVLIFGSPIQLNVRDLKIVVDSCSWTGLVNQLADTLVA